MDGYWHGVVLSHEGERRLRLASFLPSSRPDLRGHDREGSEEASREGVKNPRFEESPGRDRKILIRLFLIDLEPLRRRLPAGESWLEGGAVKPKAVESGSSLNP